MAEKNEKILISEQLKRELSNYIMNMEDNEYLFQSREGNNKAISKTQVYRVLKKAAKKVGLKNIGTQTLRKTFGYHYYKQHQNLALLQKIFNHSAPSVTLDYIGVKEDVIEQTKKDFNL